MTIDYTQIEEPIRDHVRALNDSGWVTDASCGHAMWVRVECPMGSEELRLVDWLRVYLGHSNFETERDYGWRDGKDVTIHFPAPDGHGDGPHRLILLKVEPSNALYFVLRVRDYGLPRSAGAGDDAYFYDEHTCPTNWTSQIVAVVKDGDQDPHGFAKFIEAKPEPDGLDDLNGDWSEVFAVLKEMP